MRASLKNVMKIPIDREQLLGHVLQLRRAEEGSPEWEGIATVRSHLEDELGRTVPRSVAARALGISQPALDKWIARGEIPIVLSPEGRSVVPVRVVIDLVEALEERREVDPEDPYPLSSVMRGRRARVERLDPETILPSRYRRSGRRSGHRGAELRGLAYHRAVAQRLDPRVVRDARAQLNRWRREGKIDERYAVRWEQVLSRPLNRIARAISQDSQTGRDLRQNSPFTGVLSEPERRRILEIAA
ncbi:MAG: hypothetical protein M3433_03320 [Actinomycetota bacterium]|nr:hypothetical protein [Actinomycetota bacterium]